MNIKSTRSSVDLWPKYKVFIYILKGFSNLITSSLPCKKYGRILYRTNCDPFLMLAHSLGSKKVEVKEKESFCEQMRPVMRHLNKKVHDLGDKLCNSVTYRKKTYRYSSSEAKTENSIFAFRYLI